MENIKIVRATLEDVDKLQRISRQTFTEAFSDSNGEEDMKQYMDESFSSAKLEGELTNTLSHFYFAVLNDEVIGYLKLNFGEAQTEIQDEHALEIERVYVLQAYYGKKVGQLLYEHALHIAVGMNANYIWLGVWEKNERALAFYRKNGFVPFSSHVFKLGEDVQTDIMMKKML